MRFFGEYSHIQLVTAPNVDMKSRTYSHPEANQMCQLYGMVLSKMVFGVNIGYVWAMEDHVKWTFNVSAWSTWRVDISTLVTGQRFAVICQVIRKLREDHMHPSGGSFF